MLLLDFKKTITNLSSMINIFIIIQLNQYAFTMASVTWLRINKNIGN